MSHRFREGATCMRAVQSLTRDALSELVAHSVPLALHPCSFSNSGPYKYTRVLSTMHPLLVARTDSNKFRFCSLTVAHKIWNRFHWLANTSKNSSMIARFWSEPRYNVTGRHATPQKRPSTVPRRRAATILQKWQKQKAIKIWRTLRAPISKCSAENLHAAAVWARGARRSGRSHRVRDHGLSARQLRAQWSLLRRSHPTAVGRRGSSHPSAGRSWLTSGAASCVQACYTFFDWLVDWLKWTVLKYFLIDWLIELNCLAVFSDRLIDWLMEWMDGLIDWLIDWLID